MTDQTALTVVQRASLALGAAEHEQALRALAAESKDLTAITNAAGRDQIHAARMRLVKTRTDLEKLGKAARDDATKFSKAVIAEEARLIGIISPEEDRLQALQSAWDEAREAERLAKVNAERQRITRIQGAIADIRNTVTLMAGKSGAQIGETMVELQGMPMADFAELTADAEAARQSTLEALAGMYNVAIRSELEAARLKAERAELDRQIAEQAAAKAAQEQADRERREALEAEERASRARIEAQEREARLAREEQDRQARVKLEAEQAALKAERDRLEALKREGEERERRVRIAAEEAQRHVARAEQDRIDAERRATEAQEAARVRTEQEAETARLAQVARQQAADAAALDRVRRAAPALLAALKALLAKAYKQNWNDAYPEQLAQAETAIALAEDQPEAIAA